MWIVNSFIKLSTVLTETDISRITYFNEQGKKLAYHAYSGLKYFWVVGVQCMYSE